VIDDLTLQRVFAAFDIAPKRVVTAGGTAGRTWRVETDKQRWFMRCRGVRTSSPARIAFDHAVRRHLVEHSYPTVSPVAHVNLDGKAYELYPLMDGKGYSPDIAEPARISTAHALARFHDLTRDLAAPCESYVPQFTHFDPPVEPRPRFDDPGAFLDVIDRFDNRAVRQRVEWFKKIYDPLYARLPHGIIHGDYNSTNLLFDDDGGVVGVFDFDWAWRDTRVRDIGDGMLFFGAQRDDTPDSGNIWSLTACPQLDTDPMRCFVDAYEQASPLSDDERRAVPFAMLGRWIAIRLEGMVKVPDERKVEFMLMDFERPFEWFDEAGGVM
jgi:Ser/Thr protein kinase RdoA (MazF antagonist)